MKKTWGEEGGGREEWNGMGKSKKGETEEIRSLAWRKRCLLKSIKGGVKEENGRRWRSRKKL